MFIRLFLSNNSTFDFITDKYVTVEGFAEDLAMSQTFDKNGHGFYKYGEYLDFSGMFIKRNDIVAFKQMPE
ncbi:hypothetical protein ACO11K_003639 [Bacillus cytotoxicus]|nr:MULTISPECIES: hypothetical protein [unclassified Bacillus cereus group]